MPTRPPPPVLPGANPSIRASELPENAPRYVLLSYELNHSDGRKSFPLVLVNWAPRSSEISLLTLHASAFLDFQSTVGISLLLHLLPLTNAGARPQADVSKVIEVREGAEAFTKDLIDSKLLHG